MCLWVNDPGLKYGACLYPSYPHKALIIRLCGVQEHHVLASLETDRSRQKLLLPTLPLITYFGVHVVGFTLLYLSTDSVPC